MNRRSWNEIETYVQEQISTLENNKLKSIYEGDELIKFIVLMDKQKVKGYISYKENGDFFDVYNLVVDQQYQRAGNGTILLNALSSKNIILEVNAANEKAVNLYNKLGFIKEREIDNYYTGVVNSKAYVMIKYVFKNH